MTHAAGAPSSVSSPCCAASARDTLGGAQRWRRLGARLVPFVGAAVLVLAWFVVGLTPVLERLNIPTVGHTAGAFANVVCTAGYWSAVLSTLYSWMLSLFIGSAIGIAIGLLCGVNAWVQRSFQLPVEFFKTIPIVGVLPLGILALGLGRSMGVTLVAFAVVWPLAVQTIYGVRAVDRMSLDSARAIGMGPVRRFLTVIVPEASPFIATGVRVAASMALIITVVVGLIAGGTGIGAVISNAALSGESALPIMYALIITSGLLGVSVVLVISLAERRLLHWHAAYRKGIQS